jgi:hypothetical protein
MVRLPATSRHRGITYRSAIERLFLRWDRSNPADVAAKRAHSALMRKHSRRMQDERSHLEGSEAAVDQNFGGAISVMLLDEDAQRVREAFRAAYSRLADADRRARSLGEGSSAHPYHVMFDLRRLVEPELPMAEYFVFERSKLATERGVLGSSAKMVLSPRECQIAELLAKG